MTVSAPDGSKIVDNIVGTGNNMRGEIAVNAVSCEQNLVSCPVGLTIKMQYKSQFHPDIVSQNIPYSIEFIRKDIYSPLTSITDIPGEFAKLGAEIVEDTNKSGEFVVKFTLNSPDLPMPKGYTMQVTLKKIADDTLLDGGINIDNSRYFSTGGETGPVKVTGVTVNNKNIGIEIGKTAKLNYTITPLDADNKAVIFATYDNKVAEIGLDGTITAVGIGETEVEVRTVDGSFTDKAKVTVVDKLVSVEAITAFTDTVTLDINLDPSKASKTADVKFQVTPANATNKQILLKDGYNRNLIDAKIVNGEDGVATLSISAKFSTGTTNVTVYADSDHSIEKTVKVTVNDTTIHPVSVSISDNNAAMTVGDTKQLTATVMPESAFIKTVKWSSNNVSVVEVDENGMLTAVSAGSAAITVTTVDGGYTAECNVTVENKYVPVEHISFGTEETTFAASATGISVKAHVIPSDATNQEITYSSSDASKVAVDANTGDLTIVNSSDKSNYQVTITAKSDDDESKTAEIIVHITSTFVEVESVTITNKLASPSELKLGSTYTVAHSVLPAEATNKNVDISADNNDVLSYDAETKTFTAHKAGTATITVQSQSNPNKQDSFQVTVWEPADITGEYDVTSLEIQYGGVTAKSSEVNTVKPYHYDNKFFAVSTENGVLDITGKIHIVWSQFIDNPVLDTLRYRYFSLNETLSDRDNSKDKLSGKGFTFNSDGSLTYEFPFVLGADDTLKYSAGSSSKLIFKLSNKQAYSAIEAGKMRDFTPVHFEDPYSIQGTYDMLTFETLTNALIKKVNVGAKYKYNNGASLSRLIGEVTVVVDTKNKTIDMKSKIQMNSPQLRDGAAGQDTNAEQYQNTTYDRMNYTLESIVNGFGSGTSKTTGTVTSDDTMWENQKSDIKIYSTFKEYGIATVQVSVYGKKKSDEVITLDPDIPYYCNDYFYLPDNAKANCPISNEPPAEKGVVTQLW